MEPKRHVLDALDEATNFLEMSKAWVPIVNEPFTRMDTEKAERVMEATYRASRLIDQEGE